MLLHTSALRHKYFFTEMMLQRGAFRRSRVYTQAQVPLHRGAFSHKCFYTQCFYTVLLHASSLTQRFLLPANTFTQRSWALHDNIFLTEAFFHADIDTRARFNRDVFKHARVYTEIVVHRNTFTQRCVHTEMHGFTHRNTFTHTKTDTLLHRDDFTLSSFTHRYHYKQRCFDKGMDLHEGLLCTDVFTQAYFCMISDGGHAFRATRVQ